MRWDEGLRNARGVLYVAAGVIVLVAWLLTRLR